ncbi:MAG: hypothetical protein AAB425_07750 [Bdellovibrionota bacterium]
MRVSGALLIVVLLALVGSAVDVHAEPDPFSEIQAATPSPLPESGGWSSLWKDGLLFRKEWMSVFGFPWLSQQSLGFEIQKKFSTARRTYLGFNIQNRLARRDGSATPWGWAYEIHNLYADLYDPAHPFLPEKAQAEMLGRLNLRVGKSYVPFGINVQTDTHATLLQLSNEENFGFERDWGLGLWGLISEELRYDFGYFLGSGHVLRFKRQIGVVAGRVGLSNHFLNEYGVEGGGSILIGQRLSDTGPHRTETLWTERAGIDARFRHWVPSGTAIATVEWSAGQDYLDDILTQLYQVEYLHGSRRFGAATQYRWFAHDPTTKWETVTARAGLEATMYFRNEESGANLHWIKLAWEHRFKEALRNVWQVQYYLLF